MRICQLEISGFRGIQSGKISFPEHGVLFGPNNAGKSSIIDALSLLFERERMSRQLSDWDFFGGNPKPESRITIIGTLTDFAEKDKDDPSLFPKWFNRNAARTTWWRASTREVSYELDRPKDARLAAQIAMCVHYVEEECEFELRRYFYDGPCDPFTEDVRQVPSERLQEVGVFVLPGNRQWEKLLSFGSSSFLKVLKSTAAVPGASIEALKQELRDTDSKVEQSASFKPLLDLAEEELKGFLMMEESSTLAYRPTNLDATSVLQSLVLHVLQQDGSLLPFARNGSGTVSLQSFLIVLAFAEHRRKANKNFILLAEEPELHLHPPLHRRLANRIRRLSNQSIVTTHSPLVAGSFHASTALYIQNQTGSLTANAVETGQNQTPRPSAVSNLFTKHRDLLYEALMGPLVLIPEGETDYRWLRFLHRAAESAITSSDASDLTPITIIPTQSSAVVDTFGVVSRLRPDAIPLIDGDPSGDSYLSALERLTLRPKCVVQYGKGASVECLAAWILEPSLASPGPILGARMQNVAKRTLAELQDLLISNKRDTSLAEELAWEATEHPSCVERLLAFFGELAAVVLGGAIASNPLWVVEQRPVGVKLCTASFIRKL
jgi:putative ATP-dependent endonuclease of OLD family